jgi:hypothetical protein
MLACILLEHPVPKRFPLSDVVLVLVSRRSDRFLLDRGHVALQDCDLGRGNRTGTDHSRVRATFLMLGCCYNQHHISTRRDTQIIGN